MIDLLPHAVGASRLLILMSLLLLIGLTAPDHDGEPDSRSIGDYAGDAAGRLQDFGARQWARARNASAAWRRLTRRQPSTGCRICV